MIEPVASSEMAVEVSEDAEAYMAAQQLAGEFFQATAIASAALLLLSQSGCFYMGHTALFEEWTVTEAASSGGTDTRSESGHFTFGLGGALGLWPSFEWDYAFPVLMSMSYSRTPRLHEWSAGCVRKVDRGKVTFYWGGGVCYADVSGSRIVNWAPYEEESGSDRYVGAYLQCGSWYFIADRGSDNKGAVGVELRMRLGARFGLFGEDYSADGFQLFFVFTPLDLGLYGLGFGVR